jgi:hypothetical protein
MKMDTLPNQEEFGTEVIDEILTSYHPTQVAKKVEGIVNTRGEGYAMKNSGPEMAVNSEVLLERALAVQARAEAIGQPSRLEHIVKWGTTISGALIGLAIRETLIDEETLPVFGFLVTSMATAFFGRQRTNYSRAQERIKNAQTNEAAAQQRR